MADSFGRYVRWWVRTYKGGILVFAAPLSIPIGLVVLAAAIIETDQELLLTGGAFLLFGLFATLFPLLRYRRNVTERDT